MMVERETSEAYYSLSRLVLIGSDVLASLEVFSHMP
jgi:hypothetical protein